MFTDQFAPGVEGLVTGVIVLLVVAIVFGFFHKEIIKAIVHWLHLTRRGVSNVEADAYNAEESERD